MNTILNSILLYFYLGLNNIGPYKREQTRFSKIVLESTSPFITLDTQGEIAYAPAPKKGPFIIIISILSDLIKNQERKGLLWRSRKLKQLKKLLSL